MVGIVKSTHSKAQIIKHFIMQLCSAHFINITLLYNSRYIAVRYANVRNYLSLLSMYYGSCPSILCLKLIHRTHFSNLSTEIIRTCSVLLFKSSGIDHIPVELRHRAEQFLMRSINLFVFWNKEDLPEEWKESFIVPIYKCDKRYFSNYKGISLLSATYNILSNILL